MENSQDAVVQQPKRRRKGLVIMTLLWLISTSLAVYFYLAYSNLKADPNLTAQQTLQEVISKVARLMVLPTDENPTLATVSDAARLKESYPALSSVENGFKILMYPKAGKAVIYDPTKDRVVDVVPFNVAPAAPVAPAKTSTKNATSTSKTATSTSKR